MLVMVDLFVGFLGNSTTRGVRTVAVEVMELVFKLMSRLFSVFKLEVVLEVILSV